MFDWHSWLVIGHAFGVRYALPIPLVLFVLGGGAVVLASFLLVLPRPVPTGRLANSPDRLGTYRISTPLTLLSWLMFLFLIVAGLFGSQAVAENILPTAFWLILWIAVPITCGVLGDWTAALNPFAALARATDRPAIRQTLLAGPTLPWPARLGWWPSTILFSIVACGELIYNDTATRPAVTAFGLLAYALLNAVMGFAFGSQVWLERGELFSVLYNTWGRLGFFRFGAPGTQGFGGGLKARFEPVVSRITFVLLLLVSVSFDGLLATPAWKHAREQLPASIAPGTAYYLILTTVAFIGLLLVAWLLFGGFAFAVQRGGDLPEGVLTVLARLLPSLLPIAFGYLLAHNAEYLAINGQLLLPLLGNPARMSWWPTFPYPFNDSYEININLLPSSVVWYSQVGLIIFVHIAAVILAHEYLTKAAQSIRQARRAEWPWIIEMVLYTMSSLWLLAQPLVKGG
ncbi:MAG: hypothetical protein NVSMB52_09920 [Chloroflexota bacterium]